MAAVGADDDEIRLVLVYVVVQHFVFDYDFDARFITDLDDALKQQLSLRVDDCHPQLIMFQNEGEYDRWFAIPL